MIERLELALGRLAEIPGEDLAPEPYRDYFERTAAFLLAAVKNENRQDLWQDIDPAHYGQSYANPSFAAARLGLEMGQVLSAVCAELRAVIPCAASKDEAGVANLLELFLEIYGDFTGDGLPSPGAVKAIFRFYAEDYLADRTYERISERVCPGQTAREVSPAGAPDDWEETEFIYTGRPLGELLKNADFSNPGYLWSLGGWVSPAAAELAARCGAMDTGEVEELAGRLARSCLDSMRRRVCDPACVRTIGLRWPAGAERILLAVIDRLKAEGYGVTLPRAAARLSLKNDDLAWGFGDCTPNPAFEADHSEDLALWLDDNYASRRKRAMREAYEAFREEAAVFGGVYFLNVPGADSRGGRPDREGDRERRCGPCPEAIAFTPAEARMARSLDRSLEEIRGRYEAR